MHLVRGVTIILAVRRVAPFLLAFLFVAPGCSTGKARLISGAVLGKLSYEPDAAAKPVTNARVLIAVDKAVSNKPETGPRFELPYGLDALTNLRGIAVSAPDGSYAVDALFTPWVEEDYPLLKGWSYEVEIVAPGYYVFTTSFVYDGSDPTLNWVLERKANDVVDDTGGVQENMYLLTPAKIRRFE